MREYAPTVQGGRDARRKGARGDRCAEGRTHQDQASRGCHVIKVRADWCRPPGCHSERHLQVPEYRPCLAGMSRMFGIRRMPVIISGSARPALRAGTGACCINVRANGTSAEADRLRFLWPDAGRAGCVAAPTEIERRGGRSKDITGAPVGRTSIHPSHARTSGRQAQGLRTEPSVPRNTTYHQPTPPYHHTHTRLRPTPPPTQSVGTGGGLVGV